MRIKNIVSLRTLYSLGAACSSGVLTFAMSGAELKVSDLMKSAELANDKKMEKPSPYSQLMASFMVGAMTFAIVQKMPSLWPKKPDDDGSDGRGDNDDFNEDPPRDNKPPALALILSGNPVADLSAKFPQRDLVL